ncbi:MAG: rod shape-determining protein MreC [Bacteroidales bacterium]|nr:rod shape-determining protein MreC [Bacteroidales bacterium]MDD3430792.1 rod shape-determining protein MreC [Bacteroidales bacterium]MDD4361380.1 rod shape-determining protein MreC [Bacteroidales bacterium]MDD4430888.1 rod shape-determining protein MreC [Bacteroidales bacterium]
MRQLIQFLARYSNFFLFLFLEILSLILLFRFNDYQQGVLFSSANSINGKLYTYREAVSGFFSLRENNAELLRLNSEMELRIARLEENLRKAELTEQALKEAGRYEYIQARVIKNSVSQLRNYITLDVGRLDGVAEGMGVCSHQGIVGVVSVCSDHYSVVIPVLNPEISFSCLIAGSNSIGSLNWKGGDTRYAWLEELPDYAFWAIGDTVVSSGFSDAFPRGIPVGVIHSIEKKSNSSFHRSRVRLFTRFESLADVRVISHFLRDERLELGKELEQ